MTGIIDTHCHLYWESLFHEVDAVIQRAVEHDVTEFVVPGIDIKTSQAAIQLAEDHPMIYAAVGIHPNSEVEVTEELFDQLEELLSHPKVVAVGEIGLDYYRNKSTKETQKMLLQRQLDIAINFNLPIILHNREAIEDLFQVINERKNDLAPARNGKPNGVFHAFSEDLQWAKQVTQMGFYIGVGGMITYPKANNLREVVRSIPHENILVETDAPFLPPQPFRGKRNEPAYLSIIVNELSKELNLDRNILVEITHQNSNRLFGIN